MAARIGIIGAGQVGAAAAYLLSATPGVQEIVLVDLDRERAAGEAADISHAAAFGNATNLRDGTCADLAGAGLVVITAGASLKPGQTRLDLLQQNVRVVSAVLEGVLKAAPDAVLLFATNPVDVMPALAVKRFGVPAARAVGTGCALDSIRFRDCLARHLGLSATSVHASVLGEHGDSSVLHWSGARIGGLTVEQAGEQLGRPLRATQHAQIAEEVRTSAYRIKAGKGVSNFGIGGCIARLARAILLDERVVFSLSTFLPEVLGVTETGLSLPHVLGAEGASKPLMPWLDPGEEKALRKSAGIIADKIRQAIR